MRDYNCFWTYYLSFVFMFFVMIISFMFYIVIMSNVALILKITFSVGLNNHIILLSGILYYCGSIVLANIKLSNNFSNFTAQTMQTQNNFTFLQLLKMASINQCLSKLSTSGFCLLNNYVLSYDTFRFLIINTTIYFILIVK